MEKDYELKIDHVEAHRELNGLEKVIHKVHFRYYVVNSEGFETHLHKTVDLQEVDADSFVSFDDVTKEMVLGWISPSINETALKAEVDQKLQDAFYPDNLILEIKS